MPQYVRDLGETLCPVLSLGVVQLAFSASSLSDRTSSLCSLATEKKATTGNKLVRCHFKHLRDDTFFFSEIVQRNITSELQTGKLVSTNTGGFRKDRTGLFLPRHGEICMNKNIQKYCKECYGKARLLLKSLLQLLGWMTCSRVPSCIVGAAQGRYSLTVWARGLVYSRLN